MNFRPIFLSCLLGLLTISCTAGVAHTVSVILPTPHLGGASARQFGNLFFYTDRNIPDTSFAYNALLEGKIVEALNILGKIDAANLPSIQKAYWQNDVAVCFILEGRYKEADELLVQAGIIADEEPIRHNHRVSVYLNDSQNLAKKKLAPATVAPDQPEKK